MQYPKYSERFDEGHIVGGGLKLGNVTQRAKLSSSFELNDEGKKENSKINLDLSQTEEVIDTK